MQVTSSLDPLGAADPKPLALAYLNSYFQTAALHGNGEPERQTSHNPLDNAILNAQCNRESGYEKLDEIPFDFERRRVSVVLSKAGLVTLITKGAPESLFPICEQCECAGKLVPLNDRKEQILKTFENLCQQGLRAVGVAYRDLSAKPAFSKDDEHGLVFAGFVTFLDPPAPGVTETLTQLRRDGVRVKVLTGDNEMVAAHICSQVGLNGNRIIVGRELETMSAPALAHAVEQTDIFARVSPAQKERILLALKSRKHVVGFLGDGINDAPSLHAADVGITVSSAVDVAKEAADIVLTKPGLKVLHLGILEGRRAFGNVMKYLLMGTSSNFGNMFSMAAASVFLRFLPMLPTQILLNNFLYDLAQITIPTDSVDPSYIRKPRRWDIGQIRRFMLYIGPISSIYDFLTFFVLLRVFHASEKLFHTGWFVESLATQTFVLFIIRTMGNPLRSRPSRPLAVTTIVAVLVGLYLPFSPLAAVLGFVPLPIGFFGFLLFATTTYLLLVEIAKRRILRA
jgi:Mg2+-importing ATPase